MLHCVTNNGMNEVCLEKNGQDSVKIAWRKTIVIFIYVRKGKAIPVTGRGGP
jgi:hypothetical protein